MTDTSFFTAPNGQNIAHVFQSGQEPALVFLPGYKSDMAGGKAQAVLEWAKANGRACLLLDYSGCGLSSGDFADGTLSRWRDEVLALIAAKGIGEAVVIGSSMGGWLMLLVAQALSQSGKNRVKALIGIAAAPDFTDWGTDPADQAELALGRTVWKDNPYGPAPTPTHPGFWQDGQSQRLLQAEIAFDGPVRLLHGQRDDDVPWHISLQLAEKLRSNDVQVTLIKDGDHRLSRHADIALLLQTIAALPCVK